MKVVATTRNAQGTSASRRLRHEGKVPGVLYGGKGKPIAIEVVHNPLFHSLRRERFHASILDMELDGKSEQVLLRDFQMHPYRQVVLHVDFQRVAADQPVHMRVPLHFTGQEHSPAVKESGAIVGHVLSDVDISCLPKDLPEFIEVDLGEMKLGDTVHLSDVKLPKGVELAHKIDDEHNPAVAVARHARAEAEAEGEAPAAESAEVPAAKQDEDAAE
jgi:large subunit ribosomal protein L25